MEALQGQRTKSYKLIHAKITENGQPRPFYYQAQTWMAMLVSLFRWTHPSPLVPLVLAHADVLPLHPTAFLRSRITNQITCCNPFVLDDVLGQNAFTLQKLSFLQIYPSCLKSSVQQRTCFLHQMRMTKLTSYIRTCLHPKVFLTIVDIHVLSLIGERSPDDPFPFPRFTRQQYKEQESLAHNITRGKIHNLNSRCWYNGVRKLKGLLEIDK